MAGSEVRAPEEQIAHALRGCAARQGLLFNIVVTMVEVGGSIGLFQLAERWGANSVTSYLVGSIAPVIGGLMVWARARKFSGASAAIFGFSALSAGIAFVGSTSPKMLLYKDCAATAVIGLVFLISCVIARKPLAFYMAQRYGTNGSREAMAVFDTLWDRSRDFRTCLYRISYLWAALFVVQAAGTAAIIYVSRYSDGYDYDQILPWAAIALGIAGSLALGQRLTRGVPVDALAL
ncbi:MAG: hypothetical protein NVSMB48_26240 [Marmoricola sp.]